MKKRASRKQPTKTTVDDLHLDPENARQRTERSRAVLESSLEKFGAGRSVVVDADGIVRAGNGTVEAAQRAGITKVREIETDGTELVVVRRTDLRGMAAKAYAIADNRTSELSTWDQDRLEDQLQEICGEGFDLGDLGFADLDLDEALDDVGERNGGDAGKSDNAAEPAPSTSAAMTRADELQTKWNVTAGQTWEIAHAEHVATLVAVELSESFCAVILQRMTDLGCTCTLLDPPTPTTTKPKAAVKKKPAKAKS